MILVAMALVATPALAHGDCDATVPEGDSIQAALDAADAGDTICVEEGTFAESINIPAKDDLTLRGAGSDETTIDAGGASNRAVDASFSQNNVNDGLSLSGFEITGSTHYGLKIAFTQNTTVTDVFTTENGRTGIDLHTVSGFALANSLSNHNGGNGISIRNAEDVVVNRTYTNDNAWGGLAFYAVGDESVSNVTVMNSAFVFEGPGIYFQYEGEDKYTDIQIGDYDSSNLLLYNDVGIYIEDREGLGAPDATGITVRGNTIADNEIAIVNEGIGTLDAIGNFWGSPLGQGMGANAVEGDIDTTPWCVLPGCPVLGSLP